MASNPRDLNRISAIKDILKVLSIICPRSDRAASIQYLFACLYLDEPEIKDMAINVELNLKQTSLLACSRKYSPSLKEIKALSSAEVSIQSVAIYFEDGHSQKIPLSIGVTSSNVIRELARNFELRDPSGWSLFERLGNKERLVKPVEYIADVLSHWEKEDSHSNEYSPPSHSAGLTDLVASFFGGFGMRKKSSITESTPIKPTNTISPQPIDEKYQERTLVIKRRIFKNPVEKLSDPVEISLLYSQTLRDILNENITVHMVVAAQLAALQIQVQYGELDEKEAEYKISYEMETMIPPKLMPEEGTIEVIAQILEHYMGICELRINEAKARYLAIAKKAPHFGLAMIQAKHKGFWSHSENLIIAVGSKKLEFLSVKTRATFMSHTMANVVSYEQSGDILTLNIMEKDEEDDSGETILDEAVYQFTSSRADEIMLLLREYRPVHKGVSKVFGISQEILERDLLKGRKMLLVNDVMKIPGPNGRHLNALGKDAKKGKIMNSITKISESVKGSITSLGSNGSLADEVYFEPDWQFCAKALGASLSSVESMHLNQWAVHFSTLILTIQADSITTSAHLKSIEEALTQCIASTDHANEAYLELIKFTSNHVESDGKQILGIWRLFALLISCVKPSGDSIVQYVKYHLAQRANPDQKLIRQTRLEEAKYAEFCSKLFSKTNSGTQRKFSPCSAEINAVISKQKIRQKIQLIDKTFRTVYLESSTSVKDLLVTLLEKMKLKGSTGFALYESDGTTAGEHCLFKDHYICDIFSKWQSAGKPMHLLLKKRLFLDTHAQNISPIEENLLRVQAIQDIRDEFLPVGEEQSTYLAALLLQSGYGNHNGENMPQDDNFHIEFIKEVLPARHTDRKEIITAVKNRHKGLTGKSTEDCHTLYMDVIRSYKLYGYSIFEVTVLRFF